MELNLGQKNAVITGATKGIGLAMLKQFATEGVNVAFCARSPDDVATTLAAMEGFGVRLLGSVVDVKDCEAYKRWLEEAAAWLGSVDIFVPNVSAGGGLNGESSWHNNFEVDLMGAVRGCEILAPHMSSGGSIVFISSTAAVENFIAPQAYNALKAALINYSKHLSQFYAPSGIRVNSVSPGPVLIEGGAWDEVRTALPELYEETLGQIPIGRMGSAAEIANVVVFLASSAASFVTGTNVIVDGGMTRGVQY